MSKLTSKIIEQINDHNVFFSEIADIAERNKAMQRYRYVNSLTACFFKKMINKLMEKCTKEEMDEIENDIKLLEIEKTIEVYSNKNISQDWLELDEDIGVINLKYKTDFYGLQKGFEEEEEKFNELLSTKVELLGRLPFDISFGNRFDGYFYNDFICRTQQVYYEYTDRELMTETIKGRLKSYGCIGKVHHLLDKYEFLIDTCDKKDCRYLWIRPREKKILLCSKPPMSFDSMRESNEFHRKWYLKKKLTSTKQIEDFNRYYNNEFENTCEIKEETENLNIRYGSSIRYLMWLKNSIHVNRNFYCYPKLYNDANIFNLWRCRREQILELERAQKDVFIQFPYYALSFVKPKDIDHTIMTDLIRKELEKCIWIQQLFDEIEFPFLIDRDDNIECNYLWIRFDRKEILLCSKTKLLGENPNEGEINELNKRWNTIQRFQKFIESKCDVRPYQHEINWFIEKFSPKSMNKPIDDWSEEEIAEIENVLKLKNTIKVSKECNRNRSRKFKWPGYSKSIILYGKNEIEKLQTTQKEALVHFYSDITFDKPNDIDYPLLTELVKLALVGQAFYIEEVIDLPGFKFTIDPDDNVDCCGLWFKFDEKEIILCGKSKVPGLVE